MSNSSEPARDGRWVEGFAVGTPLGASVGAAELGEGDVGPPVGTLVSGAVRMVGAAEVGAGLGAGLVGAAVGAGDDGSCVVGVGVGTDVGGAEGAGVGACEGLAVGAAVMAC